MPRDGEISADEIAGATAALIKLDKDGDGKLSSKEMMPAMGGRGGRGGPGGPGGEGFGGRGGPGGPGGDMVERILGLDQDKDGKITLEELPERMKGIMARADKNSDEVLTKEEIVKAAETMGRGRGGRGAGGRGAGGRGAGGRGGRGGRGEESRPQRAQRPEIE